MLYQLSYGHHHKERQSGRGREIRTPDILLPQQARYQTALYPELPSLFSLTGNGSPCKERQC